MPFWGLSKTHSSSSELENPHEWKLPHHFHAAHRIHEQPQIPDPSIFTDLSLPHNSRPSAPRVGELATHLCLLESFHKFKQDALNSKRLDDVFVSVPRPERKTVGEDEKGGLHGSYDSVSEARELNNSHKWNLVVQLAVARFVAWWQRIEGIMVHAATYARSHDSKERVTLTKDYLPPLDVLMVWHSYILDLSTLDPENFTPSAQKAASLDFPWKAICDVIDRENFSYNLPKSAQNIFRTHLKQSPDLLTYISSPPPYTFEKTSQPLENLTEAVLGQGHLVESAHLDLWIRSPGLRGSLDRSLQQYENLAPALLASSYSSADFSFDVFFVWMTHRLCPSDYHQMCNKPQDTKSLAPTTSTSEPSPATVLPSCLCWAHELLRSNPNPTSAQLHVMKEDLGFHIAVERARTSGNRLPTRKPNVEDKKKEDVWEMEYGLQYYEEVTPAVYDGQGRCIKEEKRKIKREKGYTSGINGLL